MAVKIVRVLNTDTQLSVVIRREENADHNRTGIRFKRKRVKIWMEHWRIKLIIWSVGDSRRLQSSKRENIRRSIWRLQSRIIRTAREGRIESQGIPVCDTCRSYQFHPVDRYRENIALKI